MRPLVYITVGYIIGIMWGLYLNISIIPAFILLGAIIFIFLKIDIIKKEYLTKYELTIAMFVIFAIISNIQILYLENKFECLYHEEEVSVVGIVVSNKEEGEYVDKYTVKVISVDNKTKYKNTRLIIYVGKEVEFEYGDVISFNGTFSFPSEATNYKAFDYREYLKIKKVYGIITDTDNIKILDHNGLGQCFMIANNISTKIKENLNIILGEDSSLIIGILLGDTSNISDEVIENFKTSSMYHILAVSGTHVRICYIRDNYSLK